jgi:hypothetical protein
MKAMFNQNHHFASNAQSTTVQLRTLADSEESEVRIRVAENPRTPAHLLAHFIWDQEPEVRGGIARNPHATRPILEWLASDDSVDVRYTLAENPNVPCEILARLACDDNVFVADRANRTLNRILQDEAM